MIKQSDIQEYLDSLKTEEEKRLLLREVCKRDLFFLSEYVLRNRLSEAVPISEKLHGDAGDFLMRGGNRKLLMWPRGHLKSTFANRNYVCWLLINNPNETILIVSATLDNAKKKLKAIQEVFEKNELFRYLFPEVIPAHFNENWTQTQMTIPRSSTDPESSVECQGCEGELTSRHYSRIIFDDVVGKENSSTREQIEKVINFYTQSLQLLKKPVGHLLVIGTLWNYADLHNHILENLYNQYDVFVRSVWENKSFIKGEDNKYKWIKTSNENTPIYPELFGMEDIISLREEVVADPRQGLSTWMAQYELCIVDDDSAKFKRGDVVYYKKEDLKGVMLGFALLCDPAISEKKGSDETAFNVVAVDNKNNYYVIETYGEVGMDEDMIVSKYIELLLKYPIDICTMEGISFQRVIGNILKKRCDELNITLPFFPLPSAYNSASKEEKILGLSAEYKTGKLKFLENDNSQLYLLDQLWLFPKSKHDDRADSLSQKNHLPLYPSKVWVQGGEIEIEIKRDRYGYKIKENTNNKRHVL